MHEYWFICFSPLFVCHFLGAKTNKSVENKKKEKQIGKDFKNILHYLYFIIAITSTKVTGTSLVVKAFFTCHLQDVVFIVSGEWKVSNCGCH